MLRYEPEINAAIKLVLWKFAVKDQHATVGQQILGLYYGKATGSAPGAIITAREQIMYAMLCIVCPWLKDRVTVLLSYLGLSSFEVEAKSWLHRLETILKGAALINLVVFLRKGVYLTLVERLLGVRSFFPHRQGLRHVGFDFMTREILWHGFSEFLFFLLPLINFQRIKNMVNRWFMGQRSSGEGHLKFRTESDLKSCAVCGEWPTMAREIGCRHTFCYYCVAANLKADPSFCCPLCGHPVVSEGNIQMVKVHINPGQVKTR